VHFGLTTTATVFPEHFPNEISSFILLLHKRGHAVGQLVEALRYKPEGRRFDSRKVSLEYLIHIILLAAPWNWG
jgi:hypothetical protein